MVCEVRALWDQGEYRFHRTFMRTCVMRDVARYSSPRNHPASRGSSSSSRRGLVEMRISTSV